MKRKSRKARTQSMMNKSMDTIIDLTTLGITVNISTSLLASLPKIK